MKKVVFLFLAIALLAGCQMSTTSIGDPDDPFVVGSIDVLSKDSIMSKYTSSGSSVVMPTGLYNVGDTIYLYHHAFVQKIVPFLTTPDMNSSALDTVLAIDSIKIRPGIAVGYTDGTLLVDFDRQAIFGK